MPIEQKKIQVPIGVFSGVPDLENVQKIHFWPFLAVFDSFWEFAENPLRRFFLNFAKMCQKNRSK